MIWLRRIVGAIFLFVAVPFAVVAGALLAVGVAALDPADAHALRDAFGAWTRPPEGGQ